MKNFVWIDYDHYIISVVTFENETIHTNLDKILEMIYTSKLVLTETSKEVLYEKN